MCGARRAQVTCRQGLRQRAEAGSEEPHWHSIQAGSYIGPLTQTQSDWVPGEGGHLAPPTLSLAFEGRDSCLGRILRLETLPTGRLTGPCSIHWTLQGGEQCPAHNPGAGVLRLLCWRNVYQNLQSHISSSCVAQGLGVCFLCLKQQTKQPKTPFSVAHHVWLSSKGPLVSLFLLSFPFLSFPFLSHVYAGVWRG